MVAEFQWTEALEVGSLGRSPVPFMGRNPNPVFTEGPLTSVWRRARGDSWGALHCPSKRSGVPPKEAGVRQELWGVPSMDAPWAWITMRLRSREWHNFLQRNGEERYFTFGVPKGELKHRGGNAGLEAGRLGDPWLCPLSHPLGCTFPTAVCRMRTPLNATGHI